jgi:hypothetical protein
MTVPSAVVPCCRDVLVCRPAHDTVARIEPTAAPPAPSSPPRAGAVSALTAAFVVLVVCTNVGSIAAPTIVRRSPELLIGLSARIRHLLFAVPAGISPVAYAVIGFSRLFVAAVVLFGLGRLVGDHLFTWFDGQLGGDRPWSLRMTERGVVRFGGALVVLFPGSNIVCFLVGRRQMPWPRFTLLISLGIAVRHVWVWIAAKQFEDQLDRALDVIDRYQWWLLGLFVVLTIVPALRRGAS